jgi:hypothetical protein
MSNWRNNQRWLQGRVAHFLHRNLVFLQSDVHLHAINMALKKNSKYFTRFKLSTWKRKHLLKNLQHIYTKYIVMDFWSWKIWTSLLFLPLYIYAYFCMNFIWDILLGLNIWYVKTKKTYVQKHFWKKINQKKVMDFWMA